MHDRMPVILEAGEIDAWLTGDAGAELLKPAANEVLQKWPVSRRVNSSRTSDEDPTREGRRWRLTAGFHLEWTGKLGQVEFSSRQNPTRP